MTQTRVTELAGEKLRKAIDEYGSLKRCHPEATMLDLLNTISQKFDLSPLEADFLRRQLSKDGCP